VCREAPITAKQLPPGYGPQHLSVSFERSVYIGYYSTGQPVPSLAYLHCSLIVTMYSNLTKEALRAESWPYNQILFEGKPTEVV
jgi:hypothetical protein